MPFFQSPPSLQNQFETDRVLRSYLRRAVPEDVRAAAEPHLFEMGAITVGDFYDESLRSLRDEPVLTQWDAWGHRVDHIELTPLWKRAAVIATEHGLVGTGYEKAYGSWSRTVQFALAYLFDPSSEVYSCPLAMTDGAAKAILSSGNKALIDRAIARLTTRDPKAAWTSGQWMTERTGGSDVSRTETIARPDGATFRLYGTKWFTSATTSEMALTLARPEGNPEGSRGLALFYIETRDERGALNGIAINRLKDKLGTRMVPTAELTLDGARATPVIGTTDGVKHIAPMLNITRTWNAIGAVSGMRRGIALARDYATKRVAFGGALADKPLHFDTLAGMQAEFEGAFLLTFRGIELLGREEADALSEDESRLMRLLIPLTKLTTGKQAVAVLSEAVECFGGAGYVEDTGLPRLLRNAQVLPIWEGTTNVLSLDLLRAMLQIGGTLEPLRLELARLTAAPATPALSQLGELVMATFSRAEHWLKEASGKGPLAVELGARRLALTLGRTTELALLIEAASVETQRDGQSLASVAAMRFAQHGIDLLTPSVIESDALRALAMS